MPDKYLDELNLEVSLTKEEAIKLLEEYMRYKFNCDSAKLANTDVINGDLIFNAHFSEGKVKYKTSEDVRINDYASVRPNSFKNAKPW